jgi:hypothetical protein
MASSDITRKTDAELARFCSVQSGKLTRLQRQIAASPATNPSLETEFDQTADLLNAAIAELQARTDDTSRTTT